MQDGIGGSCSFVETLSMSIKIYKDLLACGLSPNHNKCTGITFEILKWLDFVFDLKEGVLKNQNPILMNHAELLQSFTQMLQWYMLDF